MATVESEELYPWRRLLKTGFQGIQDVKVSNHEKGCHDKFKVRKVQECPTGYPMLAAFLDSDDNFMIYRRFGFLQTRLLLEKQDELRRLEDKLDSLGGDSEDTNSRYMQIRKDCIWAEAGERRTLRQQIADKFPKSLQSLDRLMKPSSTEYESVRTQCNYLEQLFEADLAPPRPERKHAWFDSCPEKTLMELTSPELFSFVKVERPPGKLLPNRDLRCRPPLFTLNYRPWLRPITVTMLLELVPHAEALPAGQRGKPINEQASRLAQLGMSLVSILAVGLSVAGIQYLACKLIEYGAVQKPEEERPAHRANSHLAWSLAASFANLYVIRDHAREDNPLIFYMVLALNIAALENFREKQFAYFSDLGFGHRAFCVWLGTALGLVLYALNLLHCVPLGFWSSIAAPPYLINRAPSAERQARLAGLPTPISEHGQHPG